MTSALLPRSLPSRNALFWALCIVLLVVRFGGAHWHLCYDGSEQPRAVHVGDDPSSETGHVDADLNLVESGLAKYFKSIEDLPALLFACALLCLLLPRRASDWTATLHAPPPLAAQYRLAAPRAPPR